MGGEDRFDVITHDVLTEVGGNVADSNTAAGLPVARKWSYYRDGGVGMLLRPALVLGEDGRGLVSRIVVKRIEQIAVHGGITWSLGDGLPVAGDTFLEFSLISVGAAEVIERFRVVRLEAKRLLIVGHRLINV